MSALCLVALSKTFERLRAWASDVFFQGRDNSGLFQGDQKWWISFYSLETKKTTFFAEMYRKMSNFKIQGGAKALPWPSSLPMPVVEWCFADDEFLLLPTFCACSKLFLGSVLSRKWTAITCQLHITLHIWETYTQIFFCYDLQL